MKRQWLFSLSLLITQLMSNTPASAQIVEWTEAPGPLGLGYPVPIPVDTPLPFDGFRTYDGLHTRHQDLALTTPWVHSAVIGQTHKQRDIWLYRLGDDDGLTAEGLPEPAMLINGGIHAREWQSPEVVTGVLEALATTENDPLVDYLRDNVNGMIIPVLNIDGFLQTQRYPRSNYLGTDPTDLVNDPQPSPRDGRMRRKNLLVTDEDLNTQGDHLFGVDLNRNNAPFWATSAGSSFNPTSLVYHGSNAGSEPETQALYSAVVHGPAPRLRLFTDTHSFGRIYFSILTSNIRRNAIQGRLINTLINHHTAIPGGKGYLVNPDGAQAGFGIGVTPEHFATTYQIPAWTLELEPARNLGGVEYGSLGTNGHDGFIMPEAEIRRLRESMSQTMLTSFYHMAGPPSIEAAQLIDRASGAAVMIARWQVTDEQQRELFMQQLQPLIIGQQYDLWIAFNKPMRWRDASGAVTTYPGQASSTLNFDLDILAGNNFINVEQDEPLWLNQPGGSPTGYQRYRDDAVRIGIRITSDGNNGNLLQQALSAGSPLTFRLTTADLTGHQLDANPATVVDYQGGAWTGYENTAGTQGDVGGTDTNLSTSFAFDTVPELFLVEQGASATWFDPSRDGEGIMLEVYADGRAGLAWLTYDEDGNARWLVGIGEVRGNRIVFNQMQLPTGGVFGPDFDPDAIVRAPAATVELIFSSCDQGWMRFEGFNQNATYPLRRTSRTMQIDCNPPADAVVFDVAGQSGSWHDPRFDGSGFNLQWLVDGRMGLLWFTYGPDGEQVYIFGSGNLENGEVIFPQLNITRGARFGSAFDPADVERIPWGSLRLSLGCDDGTVDYESVIPAYGSGQLQLERLTILAGLECN
ncbi:MAG: hypothetical protein Tsb002_20630 [Wenzhouxiangellaceae bacterium]